MIQLKLFIVKQSKMGLAANRNLKALLESERKAEEYTLEIIDVFESPAAAEKERILATPTLMRLSPEPVKRIMGDLSDLETVKLMLEL